MKAEKKYKIKNGNLIVTNSQIKIKYEFLAYFFNILKVFGAIALILRFKSKIENLDNIDGFYENTKLVIYGLAALILLYFFIDFVFKSIWKNSIEIENLELLEIYDFKKDENEIHKDDKIEIKLLSNNGRGKELKFYKKDNCLDDFILELKKRNTRLKVELI